MKIQSKTNKLELDQSGKLLNGRILFFLVLTGCTLLLTAAPAWSNTADASDLCGPMEMEPEAGYDLAPDDSDPQKSTNVLWEITKRPLALALAPIKLIHYSAHEPKVIPYLYIGAIFYPVAALLEPDLILYGWELTDDGHYSVAGPEFAKN